MVDERYKIFVDFVVTFLLIFIIVDSFFIIRGLVAFKTVWTMYEMAIKDIEDIDVQWYLDWNATDWMFNPLRYYLWTAKATKIGV